MVLQTDQLLIENLQANTAKRQSAEGDLYRQYQYFINDGCRKYDLSEQDSFSAYSDAVLSVIQNIRQQHFDGRSSLKTYLYQIYSNKCVDLLRHNTTNKQRANHAAPIADTMISQLPDGAKNVVENLITRQQMEITRQKLSELGDKCKSILMLYEDGLSDKMIAEEMDYQNAAVVKTTRLRCMEKLREKVLGILKGI
jgi:RNA polymerase sigma factor (sigma-70 family)